jgi:hypothetical protein
MGLDIKIPIGLMFAIFGAILGIYGMVTQGNSMYEISLNININLWSGIFMFVFGVGMLLFSDLMKKKSK